MRKLIKDNEGDVYGPMICMIIPKGYDIKEHDVYEVSGMGGLEYNTRTQRYEIGFGDTDTYGYNITKDFRWIDSDGETHTTKISHYIPHDILITHFIYLIDCLDENSFITLKRELNIEQLID